MGPVDTLVQALWLFLPAYMANMAPVFALRMFPRWNAPIDGGRIWKDGRPMLGAGKTWRGFWAAAFLGALTAWAQSTIRFTGLDWSDFGHDSVGPWFPPVAGFLLGTGAIVGDMVKSFFKRRRDRKRGAPWFPFDQLDFVVGGLAFAAAGATLLHVAGAAPTNWFTQAFLAGDRWPILVVLLVLTPLLHYVVNVIGYKLKFKQVPW